MCSVCFRDTKKRVEKNDMLRIIFDETDAAWKSKETMPLLCNPKESMNVLIRNFLVHGRTSRVLPELSQFLSA